MEKVPGLACPPFFWRDNDIILTESISGRTLQELYSKKEFPKGKKITVKYANINVEPDK